MAWYPERKGLVSGIVVSGFGVGAFVFNQIQTKVANPLNLPVVNNGSVNDGYFVQEEVLSRVPLLLHLMCLIYGGLLAVGSFLLLWTERRKSPEKNKKMDIFSIQRNQQINYYNDDNKTRAANAANKNFIKNKKKKKFFFSLSLSQ